MLFGLGFISGVIVALALVGLARNGSSHWARVPSDEEIEEFDRELKARGLPLLSEPTPAERRARFAVVA
jgi:hypothetical protein